MEIIPVGSMCSITACCEEKVTPSEGKIMAQTKKEHSEGGGKYWQIFYCWVHQPIMTSNSPSVDPLAPWWRALTKTPFVPAVIGLMSSRLWLRMSFSTGNIQNKGNGRARTQSASGCPRRRKHSSQIRQSGHLTPGVTQLL